VGLKEFVIKLLESGISPATVNSYIRGFNSYLTWLHENGKIDSRLRIKKIKEPERVLKTFSDEQLKLLLSWKPRKFCEWRLYALLCLVIDTGCRIDEVLNLKRREVDFENLFFTVTGKGKKDRVVPFSFELRKTLYHFLKRHDFDWIFCTRHGGRLSYFNTLRDFKRLCEKLGINGVRCSWHTLRHGYALNHIRQGGDVFSLQRILGHSDLSVTRKYVGLTENDLKLVHQRTSILSRLK